ncbi:Uncharacterised protein [Vibrio cholerae]|nr:Uncharacterised protein [Vibrio cholerae]CSA29171.1 Uncharacterised protein [Vibrio cholerae]CSA45900.1 Uncharacterised protein [Vibrio cholerae]CSC00358.1 Uncharacterised protein [Vibrio cholerae]CSD13686.1 Uncharacterised protein [Vibrio cholerae]
MHIHDLPKQICHKTGDRNPRDKQIEFTQRR